MSLSIGGIPSPSQVLSGLGPPLPPLLRGGFADGMRTMTLQTASHVFPQVNFQSGGPPGGGALPGGQGMQLPLPGGQPLTLPGPPVPGGGPASQGSSGGMPSMPSLPSVPASGPGAAAAASAPGQLLGNAAAAVRTLLPSASPPGPPAQAGMAAGPTTAGPALSPALAQAAALPGRAVPATTASLAGTAPAPVAAPVSAAPAAMTAGVQSPGGPLAQALQSMTAAPNASAAAPAATTTATAASIPTMPAPAAPPAPSGPALQAGRSEGVPVAPHATAAPQQAAPPAQTPAPAVPAGPGLLAAPLVAAAALQAPAGTAVAGAASPAGNPQATAPVAGDLGGPARADLIATGVYTAEGPGLRRRQRMRIGPEAIGAWLLALRQGQPLLVRPHDDARREVARAMQWVFWTLALVAYGCVAMVLAGVLLVSGDTVAAPVLRRWSGELALIGLAAAAGAWWFARALARPTRPGPSSG